MTDFFETPSDSLVIVESQVRVVELAKADVQSITDSEASAFILPLSDSVTFSDSELEAPEKILSDTLGIAEAVVKAMGLYKNDSHGISEAEAWFFNKIIADQSATFADSSIVYDVTQEVWWGSIKWRTACHAGL